MKRIMLIVAALIGMLLVSACIGPFNQQPTAVLEYEPVVVYEGDWVEFNGLGSVDPDGQIVEYLFDFGHGGVTDENGTISAFYPSAGTYAVSLTVTDEQGATSFQEMSIEVLPRQALPGRCDPKVGVFLWAVNPETGEKITGTTPIFDNINKHLVIHLALPQGTVCDIHACAWDPDSASGVLNQGLLPKGVIDWPNNCFARTKGISRLWAGVQYPDGNQVVRDTDYLDFDLSEPIFRIRLLDLGEYYIFIEVWDDNSPSGYSWAKIYITAESCPEC